MLYILDFTPTNAPLYGINHRTNSNDQNPMCLYNPYAFLKIEWLYLPFITIERPSMKSICKFMQVISMKSGFPVKDFTSSFADGQALCYLINYYFPALLPKTAIKIPRSSSFQQVVVLPSLYSTSLTFNVKHKIFVQNVKLFCRIQGKLHNFRAIQKKPFSLLQKIISVLPKT